MEVIDNMDRRKMIKTTTVAAAAVALGTTGVQAGEHVHQHHHMNPYQDVIDTTSQCIKDGRACLDHCIMLLKSGDMSMANCTETVTEMLTMCDAMMQMATYNSTHVAKLAAICEATCTACEKECAKHEKIHAACAACAKSCRACIKSCHKIAA